MWQIIKEALFIVVIIHFPGEVISSSRYQSYECLARSSWRHSASRVSTSSKIVNSSVEFSACKRTFEQNVFLVANPVYLHHLWPETRTHRLIKRNILIESENVLKCLTHSAIKNQKIDQSESNSYSRLSNQIKIVGYEICFPSPLISLRSFFLNSEINVRFMS